MRKVLNNFVNPIYQIKSLQHTPGVLNIVWGDGQASQFHHRWLLDNCRCTTFRDTLDECRMSV